MKKKILITGAQGLVGSRFVDLYKNKEELLTPEIDEFNILDIVLMKKYLKGKEVSAVVNFAAYTDVGASEKEKGDENGMCWKVNVKGAQNLAQVFKNGVYFIHISTDMVFPGSAEDPGPYDEMHEVPKDPGKLTWYGYTKGVGERLLKGSISNFSILRIIYPVSAKYKLKLDYLRKPLKLYNDGNLYPLFNDQQISITYIDEACDVLNKLLESKLTGIFHCSSRDTTTPFEIVVYLIKAKYGVKATVKSISIHDFLKNVDSKARYPIFGGIKTESTQKRLGMKFSSWKEIVDKLIEQNISFQ